MFYWNKQHRNVTGISHSKKASVCIFFLFEHAGCETYSSIDEEIVVHIVVEIIYKIQLEFCVCVFVLQARVIQRHFLVLIVDVKLSIY